MIDGVLITTEDDMDAKEDIDDLLISSTTPGIVHELASMDIDESDDSLCDEVEFDEKSSHLYWATIVSTQLKKHMSNRGWTYQKVSATDMRKILVADDKAVTLRGLDPREFDKAHCDTMFSGGNPQLGDFRGVSQADITIWFNRHNCTTDILTPQGAKEVWKECSR